MIDRSESNTTKVFSSVSKSELSDLLCPLDSICSAMVFSSKDWGIDKADAWIYGIAVGWDNEALVELKKKFNWSNGTIDRLKILHNNFKKLRT